MEIEKRYIFIYNYVCTYTSRLKGICARQLSTSSLAIGPLEYKKNPIDKTDKFYRKQQESNTQMTKKHKQSNEPTNKKSTKDQKDVFKAVMKAREYERERKEQKRKTAESFSTKKRLNSDDEDEEDKEEEEETPENWESRSNSLKEKYIDETIPLPDEDEMSEEDSEEGKSEFNTAHTKLKTVNIQNLTLIEEKESDTERDTRDLAELQEKMNKIKRRQEEKRTSTKKDKQEENRIQDMIDVKHNTADIDEIEREFKDVFEETQENPFFLHLMQVPETLTYQKLMDAMAPFASFDDKQSFFIGRRATIAFGNEDDLNTAINLVMTTGLYGKAEPKTDTCWTNHL